MKEKHWQNITWTSFKLRWAGVHNKLKLQTTLNNQSNRKATEIQNATTPNGVHWTPCRPNTSSVRQLFHLSRFWQKIAEYPKMKLLPSQTHQSVPLRDPSGMPSGTRKGFPAGTLRFLSVGTQWAPSGISMQNSPLVPTWVPHGSHVGSHVVPVWVPNASQ